MLAGRRVDASAGAAELLDRLAPPGRDRDKVEVVTVHVREAGSG